MLRIGIIGCGRILAAHLNGYRQLRQAGYDDFRITALCARRKDDALSYLQRGTGPAQRPPVGSNPGDPLAVGDVFLSDFQDDTEVAVFTDYRELITSGVVDAVNDFTTHALHHQVADVALNNGKHLLTQKPLAVSVAAGRQMCELAAAKGLTLGVFENARNRLDTRQLGWLFRSGRIGDLQMMLMANLGNWWAPDQIVAETAWRHQLLEGGGISLDIGVHLFNHFRYVAGEVLSVNGRALVLERQRFTRNAAGKVVNSVDCDADDTVFVEFDTASGATGSLSASWGGHGAPLKTGTGRGMVYYGSKGSVIDDEVTSDDGGRLPLDQLYQNHVDPAEKAEFFPADLSDGFALNQLDWIQAVHEGRQPETSGQEGLRDLATAYAVLESSHAGRRVHVDEVADGSLREFQRAIDEKFGLS